MNLIIGIDPATGISSPLGFVGFDADTGEIIWQEEVGTKYKKLEHRIKDISEYVESYLVNIEQGMDARKDTVTVVLESFVMKGKGGETLQRLIGSIMGRCPYSFNVVHVPNTRMKMLVGGSGKAGKPEVAEGVLDWFQGRNAQSARVIKAAIAQKSWDVLDAFGLAIAAYELEQGAK